MSPENCIAHEQNTKDISGLKSSWGTIKWVWPTVFVVVSALTGFSVKYVLDDIRSTLFEMKTDVKELRYEMSQVALSNNTARVEVEQLKKDVAEVKAALATHQVAPGHR